MKKLFGAFLFCFLFQAGAYSLPPSPSLPAPAQGTLEQDRYLESLLTPEKFMIKKAGEEDSRKPRKSPHIYTFFHPKKTFCFSGAY